MHIWNGLYNTQRFYQFGGFFMMVFGILLIAGIIYFFAQKSSHSTFTQHHSHEDNPIEILKRRYAEGALTEEEFLKMKKDLET